MVEIEGKNKDRALEILNLLKGMKIAEAQELLGWCSQYMLLQPCCGWNLKSDTVKVEDRQIENSFLDGDCMTEECEYNAKSSKSASGWYGKMYVNHPAEVAFKILLLLEREKVPRICVDDILKALKDILDYQEIIHTFRNEKNPNFPK